MKIINISSERFEALSYGRTPLAKDIVQELDWFSTSNNLLLGILLKDIQDQDYGFVILGRDSDFIFKAVDFFTSISDKSKASKELIKKMTELSEKSSDFFHQDNTKKKHYIYDKIRANSKQHENYEILINSNGYSPAKEIIEEIVYSFKDPDGNYIEQFQTTGFNSRLFELYLYAFFHENSFNFNKDFNSPDFLVSRDRQYCFEAVTLNPLQKLSDMPSPPTTKQEIAKFNRDYMAIRYGSSLYTKLKKRYWEKDHVKGRPFVIAIHDYHFPHSMTWSRSALEMYLYGKMPVVNDSQNGTDIKFENIKEHKWGQKVIPSGFFNQPDTENISAVLFSNQSTLSKFNRMGYLAGFGKSNIKMIREIDIYDDNPSALTPKRVVKHIEKGVYKEKWAEGIVMLHNPNAINPIHPEEFPEISHARFFNNTWEAMMQPDYPFASITQIVNLK